MNVKKNIKKTLLIALIVLSVSFLMPVAQMSSVNAQQITGAGHLTGEGFRRFDSMDQVAVWNDVITPSWLSSLSEGEKENLTLYSDNAYAQINKDLREGNKTFKCWQEMIKSISNGLQKFNLSEGIVTYRTLQSDRFDNLETSAIIGTEITDFGFMSTTLLESVPFDGNVTLELHIPPGSCGAVIMSLSEFPEECEFLLDKGTSCVIREARRENEQLKLIAEVLPHTKFTFVGDATYLGGQSEKYIVQDQAGEPWLFKVSGKPRDFDWVSEAEVGANKLLKALNQPSVEIENVTLDIPGVGKRSGSVQKMIDLETWALGEVSDLTDENRKQLQESQIIDYLIANLDCHYGNFGMDSSGNIVAFDKGQAFKHAGDTSRITDGTSNPDSILSLVSYNQYNEPYYLNLWEGWLNNEYEMDLMSVKPLIEKIEGLSDTDFSDMFRAYAEGREKQLGKSAEEFLDVLVERKHTIRAKVEDFYKELASKKGISFEGFSTHADEVPAYKLAS